MRPTVELTVKCLTLFTASALSSANNDPLVMNNSSNSSHLQNSTDDENTVDDSYKGDIGGAVVIVIILIFVGVPLYVWNCRSKSERRAAPGQRDIALMGIS